MSRVHTTIMAGLLLGLGLMFEARGQATPERPEPESPAQREARMKWWREARFGFFIHWGPVSLKGTEIGWSRGGKRAGREGGEGPVPVEEYDNLYKQFNPVQFNADEWVQLARDAGMKYLVFTTKHHDGFVNFDSKLTDYKITSPESPFRRDVVAELAAACHKTNLPLGFYYSPPDWHHPDYRTATHARYVEYMHGHLRELCSNYGKVDIIWFDGLGGTAQDWDAVNLIQLIRGLQPAAIINNRAGLPEDHDTPEQKIGAFQVHRPWETCMTLCQQWAWKPNDQMKSLQECIHTLVRVVGGDGNLLFNVGPMPDGRIEPRQADRLREMGRWLATHGESIYGTRGGPYKPGTWGASTSKGKRVYLHVLKWENTGPLKLPPLAAKVVTGRLLTGEPVRVTSEPQGLLVDVAPNDRRDIDTVIVLELDTDAAAIAPIATAASDSLAYGKSAAASNVFQNDRAHYGPDKAFDDNEDTRWATDAGTTTAKLEVDLGEPKTIGRAVISEALGRVQEFELQQRSGDAWRTFHRGTTIGDKLDIRFEPINAQRIRLNILKATDGPTIWEFHLSPPAQK